MLNNERGFIFVIKLAPIQMNSSNSALQRAGERIKINKNLSSHFSRHSHVSILADNNVPLKVIMDRIGHEEAETTREIYNHVDNKMKMTVIEKFESYGL